ncbi:MAG: hypothetical protein PVI50_07975 [Gammaproteobacteria bacterium]|jgi:hypothetical protein
MERQPIERLKEMILVNRVTETFFLPDAVDEQAWTLPADIYNLSRTLLGRSEFNCAFVPIRSMQYLGVIARDEIVFVDSQAYAYRENEGGRVIMLAWRFDTAAQRAALDQPQPCRVIHYTRDGNQLHSRLVSAYREALQLVDRRFRDRALPPGGARIVPLK